MEAFKWTSDGRYIVFQSRPNADPDLIVKVDGENILYASLWVVDIASKKVNQLTYEKVDVVRFDFSPDGSQVIYTTPKEPRPE